MGFGDVGVPCVWHELEINDIPHVFFSKSLESFALGAILTFCAPSLIPEVGENDMSSAPTYCCSLPFPMCLVRLAVQVELVCKEAVHSTESLAQAVC